MWKILVRRRRRRTPSQVYLTYKPLARQQITARVEYYAAMHNFTYGRIAIRDTRRSWGSCSSKGNLNFSYKLYFLPTDILDYIVVHELCHLRELNHSQRFWAEVEKIMPAYREHYRELKHIERSVGTAVTSLEQYTKRRNQSAEVVL